MHCRINVGAIDGMVNGMVNVNLYSAIITKVSKALMLQHYAHSTNRPTATDEKTKKVFSIISS